MGMVGGFETPKPNFTEALILTRYHLVDLPKQHHQLEPSIRMIETMEAVLSNHHSTLLSFSISLPLPPRSHEVIILPYHVHHALMVNLTIGKETTKP